MYRLPDCFFVKSKPSKQDWHFDFVIENITQEQAKLLVDLVDVYAEGFHSKWGGGCAPVNNIEAQKEIDELSAKRALEGK